MTANMYEFPTRTQSLVQKTVELTERDLQDVARLLALLAPKNDAVKHSGSAPVIQSNHQLVVGVTALIAARNRRLQYFNTSMFGEPAWDMMLALYMAEASGLRLTIGRLTESSGAPATTALRWLDYLENQQLVERESHPTDARASFIALTDKAREKLEMYLSETLAEGP